MDEGKYTLVRVGKRSLLCGSRAIYEVKEASDMPANEDRSEDVREKALKEITSFRDGGRFVSTTDGIFISAPQAVDALLAAGLLRTGVEQRCVDACKAYCQQVNVGRGAGVKVDEAGRAALADAESHRPEKPRPRWGAMSEFPDEPQYPERWGVWDMTGKPGEYAKVSGLTRKQALAVADCLNALEGGAR